MPIHEFSCRACGHRFEELLQVSDPAPGCPSCGSADTRRLVSLIGGLASGGGEMVAGGGCGCGGGCACGA